MPFAFHRTIHWQFRSQIYNSVSRRHSLRPNFETYFAIHNWCRSTNRQLLDYDKCTCRRLDQSGIGRIRVQFRNKRAKNCADKIMEKRTATVATENNLPSNTTETFRFGFQHLGSLCAIGWIESHLKEIIFEWIFPRSHTETGQQNGYLRIEECDISVLYPRPCIVRRQVGNVTNAEECRHSEYSWLGHKWYITMTLPFCFFVRLLSAPFPSQSNATNSFFCRSSI